MYTAENALLRVRRIRQSRNGAFSVAELTTDIGEFKVKDALLEQFEEGEYTCTAIVSEIFLAQYISYGKAITEMRARIQDIQILNEGGQRPADYEPLEPDPLDEPEPIVVRAAEPAPAPAPAPKPAAAPADADDATDDGIDEDLYDEEIIAAIKGGKPVKLDPSIDRARLRQQTAGLKARGYRFDSKAQTWFLK